METYLIVIILCIIYVILPKFNYKKKYINTEGSNFIVNTVSILVAKDINNIKNIQYDNMFNKLIYNLKNFNSKNMTYTNILDFEKDIWQLLTNGKYYEYHKKFTIIVSYFVNNENKKGIKYILRNIHILPLIIYYMYKDSLNYLDFIFKSATLETLPKAFQISSIMNVDLETTIKKMRFGRDFIIKDIKSGNKFITRQVKQPMMASKICPFTKYVKKCQLINVKLKYSLLVIEKDRLLKVIQYKCDIHESCVLYKYKNNTIKHLYECEFWYDDKYWENKYPNEREIIV